MKPSPASRGLPSVASFLYWRYWRSRRCCSAVGVFAMGPRGLLTFAIGAIVVLLVLFIINLVLDKFGAMAGIADWTSVIKYVIAAIALIALLVLAGDALLGGGVGVTPGPLFGSTPRIMR